MIYDIVYSMSSNHTFNTLVESQELTAGENFVGVRGLALPFDKTSRNGFRYITESIRGAFQSMIGQPVLFNHDSDKVIGHVEDANFDGQGMTYRMNVGEDGPYGWVANKLRRGDLKNVSIQCLYDEDKSYLDEDGVMNAWVKEFLELSVVTIPGFADTTAQVYEKFKAGQSQGEKNMSEEEKPKTEDVVETSEPQDETPAVEETPKKDDAQTEAVDDNEDEEDEDKASEEDDRLGKLEKAVATLKAELDDMKKGDKTEESDDEESEPEEDKEKKVEEAIRNDKQSISTERLQEKAMTLSSEDLKELYGKFV